MMDIINLVKYEILEKRKYYLLFSLVIFSFYFSTVLLKYAPSDKEVNAVFSLLPLMLSLFIILIQNLYTMFKNDLSYLTFSLPINPSYIFLKRIIVFSLEFLFFTIFNFSLWSLSVIWAFGYSYFLEILPLIFNTSNMSYSTYIPLLLLANNIDILERLCIFYVFLVSSKIPFEKNLEKYSAWGFASFLLLFGQYIQRNIEVITRNSGVMKEINVQVTLGTTNFNFAFFVYKISVILICSIICIYLLNKRVEIK